MFPKFENIAIFVFNFYKQIISFYHIQLNGVLTMLLHVNS